MTRGDKEPKWRRDFDSRVAFHPLNARPGEARDIHFPVILETARKGSALELLRAAALLAYSALRSGKAGEHSAMHTLCSWEHKE